MPRQRHEPPVFDRIEGKQVEWGIVANDRRSRMVEALQPGIHGRMRRQIVTLRRPRANRPGVGARARAPAKDKYLSHLLSSGAITNKQLDRALLACSRAAHEFAWLPDMSDTVLDKADLVFVAKYGRCPTEDSDFALNGAYHKICRSLQHNWHYYDANLNGFKASAEDRLELTPVPQRRRQQKLDVRKKPTRTNLRFACVLVTGFVSAPILGVFIVRFFPARTGTAALLIGGVWLAFLIGALALTFPKQT